MNRSYRHIALLLALSAGYVTADITPSDALPSSEFFRGIAGLGVTDPTQKQTIVTVISHISKGTQDSPAAQAVLSTAPEVFRTYYKAETDRSESGEPKSAKAPLMSSLPPKQQKLIEATQGVIAVSGTGLYLLRLDPATMQGKGFWIEGGRSPKWAELSKIEIKQTSVSFRFSSPYNSGSPGGRDLSIKLELDKTDGQLAIDGKVLRGNPAKIGGTTPAAVPYIIGQYAPIDEALSVSPKLKEAVEAMYKP
jgi:hypothetical protein